MMKKSSERKGGEKEAKERGMKERKRAQKKKSGRRQKKRHRRLNKGHRRLQRKQEKRTKMKTRKTTHNRVENPETGDGGVQGKKRRRERLIVLQHQRKNYDCKRR